MRKYTVYEIEKLTDGKLSKYKLTKAIETGELNAEKVDCKKKGRGIPKYFVHEEDLNKYLQKIGESRKKKIKIPGDDEAPTPPKELKEVLNYFAKSKDHQLVEQNQEIQRLKERVHFLEMQNNTIISTLSNADETIKKNFPKDFHERQNLIQQLVSINPLSVDEQNTIIEKLGNLGG